MWIDSHTYVSCIVKCEYAQYTVAVHGTIAGYNRACIKV